MAPWFLNAYYGLSKHPTHSNPMHRYRIITLTYFS